MRAIYLWMVATARSDPRAQGQAMRAICLWMVATGREARARFGGREKVGYDYEKWGPDTQRIKLPLLPLGPGGVHKPPVVRAINEMRSCAKTERVGFEPTVSFGDTHDFQSCTFGHSVTSPGTTGTARRC
jgi:hypothetical protein